MKKVKWAPDRHKDVIMASTRRFSKFFNMFSQVDNPSQRNLLAHRPIPWNQPLPYIEGVLSIDFDDVT